MWIGLLLGTFLGLIVPSLLAETVECDNRGYSIYLTHPGAAPAARSIKCGDRWGYVKRGEGSVSAIRYMRMDCITRGSYGERMWLTPESHPEIFAKEVSVSNIIGILEGMASDTGYKTCYRFDGMKIDDSTSLYADPYAATPKGTIATAVPTPEKICYYTLAPEVLRLEPTGSEGGANCRECIRKTTLCTGEVRCAVNRDNREYEYITDAYCFAPDIRGESGTCPSAMECIGDPQVETFRPRWAPDPPSPSGEGKPENGEAAVPR